MAMAMGVTASIVAHEFGIVCWHFGFWLLALLDRLQVSSILFWDNTVHRKRLVSVSMHLSLFRTSHCLVRTFYGSSSEEACVLAQKEYSVGLITRDHKELYLQQPPY